jgi:hypothetical protein
VPYIGDIFTHLKDKLLKAAGEILGEECKIYKDKIIYKFPGSHGFDTHQDGAGILKRSMNILFNTLRGIRIFKLRITASPCGNDFRGSRRQNERLFAGILIVIFTYIIDIKFIFVLF